MFPATERRLAAEWVLLQDLARANPGRLTELREQSGAFHLRLHGPAALSIPKQQGDVRLSVHDLWFDFPVHFPAVPMELYLRIPVFHPNVHPETGFVCLWDRHRVSNSVEHGLHKLVAMLAGGLWNADALHVMQPEALPPVKTEAEPLQGVAYEPTIVLTPGERARRRRLL